MRVAAVACLLAVVSCAGPEDHAIGVVVAVDGDLTGVAAFEIVTVTGERLRFVPGPGLERFDDGAPLTHLQEHLRTGVPIQVTYRENARGLEAVAVADAT